MSLLIPTTNEEYLNEAAFFLGTGEQAPFKNPAEIDNLSPKQLKFWVEKLSATYQKQQEEMEKLKRKK